ncbi:hypothetical protein F66182_3131 [Fusarium sp. NRRL 66182]|nr:hypothetical protein F66182_3131 [Fusarium sp. NRRL 66182]
MTSWFATGRPAILEAITSACDLVDQQIASDLELVKKELDEALQQRDDHASRVSELADENAKLKEQLQQALATIDGHAQASARTGTNTPSNEPDWKYECDKVSKKFKALSLNFKQAKDALRKRKEERDRWVNHATLLEKRIKAAEEEHGISITGQTRNARATTLPVTSTEEPNPSPNTSFASEAGLEQADLDLPPLAAASLRGEQDQPLPDTVSANPNSDSTQSEEEARQDNDLPELPRQDNISHVKIKEEPSSDPPVIVSERAVRKRKRDSPDPDETPLRKVKAEVNDNSSSPVQPVGSASLPLEESIDLGDVATRLLTPRKRRELEETQRLEQLQSEAFATATTPRTLFVRPDHAPQTSRPLERTSALTPLSVNRRIVQSSREKPTTPVRKGLDRGISTLAEDGEAYRQAASNTNSTPKGRLESLLDSPAAQGDVPTGRLTPRAPARPNTTSEDLAIPGRRVLPFEQGGRVKDRTPAQQRSTPSRVVGASRGPRPTTLRDTRSPLASKGDQPSALRNKPISELRPDDFKINPQANEGHDFAFADVIRDRDERSRMQGCTDMHCCGKHFRALAISQRLNPPLTAAQRQEEQKLMEEYMGEFAYRLGAMDKKERDELWIEAKTQELANKYGKHRYHYSRMQSPPGFWNADFPNTQEIEAERSEAAQREKQIVRDRHREAMRPGGRWLFQDEQTPFASNLRLRLRSLKRFIPDFLCLFPFLIIFCLCGFTGFFPPPPSKEQPAAVVLPAFGIVILFYSLRSKPGRHSGVASQHCPPPVALEPFGTLKPVEFKSLTVCETGTMSNRHLPAGQNIQGGAGGVHGADMVGGPGGPRRRQPPPYVPQYQHHHHQHMNPMYANYMPYAPQQYYGFPPQYQTGQYQNGHYPNAQYQGGQYQNGQYQAGQYQNGGMPSPGYMPYQNYARSPPAMHQYVPMVGVSVPPSYPPRPAQQQSPALSTPYQPPPASAPIPPQTPSSTHSSQMIPPPTPPAPQETEPAPPAPPTPVVPAQAPSPPPTAKEPFRPPLPWLSHPESEFPARTAKSRRWRSLLNADSKPVSLPVGQQQAAVEQIAVPEASSTEPSVSAHTPATSTAPSEAAATPRQSAETPVVPAQQRSRTNTTTSATSTATRSSAMPAPALPSLPKTSARDAKPARAEKPANDDVATEAAPQEATTTESIEKPAETEPVVADSAPPVKLPPSSWANLFTKPASVAATKPDAVNGTVPASTAVNGHGADVVGPTNGSAPSFSKVNASSVAEAIQSFHVGLADQISFLEPRGLINTGNMCYMNSVLQVLMFCLPFYDFLSQISKRAVHSFKSDTPLIDAMIMFMHEFKIIKSAAGVDPLRIIVKNEELEHYGEPFTPEFVYEAIRQLPRFASMRRGHQQDAEEFLGFLLQSLDDECTAVLKNATLTDQTERKASSAGDDWLEVGRKQKAAVSRSSGSTTSSPISRIFGGLLRSEFRVPGLKDSITTEPYQPLQLDIGSPDVRNVVDALRGLTRPERLQGDFNSPRGKDVTATKQVFIESLPPVLILHLKRFQFDAEGNGTVKIWKKVGYPLELEIPREALSRQKRQTLGDEGMPKYRLISVVYHHGKNASGGHYTVDVRRQEGREWIRIDDTVIRRVRSEDVAEGGEEEEVKDTRKDGPASGTSTNRFGAVLDDDAGDDDGWNKVTGPAGGAKKWSSVANGTSNGSAKAKPIKDNIKDNKVAYLLFYQKV